MTTTPNTSLGSADCTLHGDLPAGSYQTCSLTYTAGPAGVDDTGSLKITMRFPTDCGTPQFNEPAEANYTTATASNGAHLHLRYDVKDNIRPWGRTLYIKILQGYLSEGDTITVVIGDRSSGSPGWRLQTFLETHFQLRVLVDRYATYQYEALDPSPGFRIVAGPPVRLVAVAPSQAIPGQTITVRIKREDTWGNPVDQPWEKHHQVSDEVGIQRLEIIDFKTGLTTATNPIRVAEQHACNRYWADLHGQSEETVGTNTIDEYFHFARNWGFLDACAHQGNDFQITDAFWETIQETTARHHEPGHFITFPGWEWSGNTGLGGDRNVLFREEGTGMISRSCRALVTPDESRDDCSHTVEDLFDTLAPYRPDVMLTPHVGGRYADLARHDADLEPVVEVHSAWGTFEWMLADAFERGYRIGIVANSDGHKGRPGASYPGASTFGSYGGLTGILADRLERDAIWQAYQSRRVYATTGARIFLDVTANDHPMGSIVTATDKHAPQLAVQVHGTSPLERVEVRNGMQVLETLRTYDNVAGSTRIKILWQGSQVRGRGRQTNWDGGLEIVGNRITGLEPINFHNPEKSCELVNENHASWKSTTTGGVSGVILDLAQADVGTLRVQTTQQEFELSIAKLDISPRSYQPAGLDKQISAYRLPATGGSADLQFHYQPRPEDLRDGDNPLYVCIVQEDGHMAWSSPIYWCCQTGATKSAGSAVPDRA